MRRSAPLFLVLTATAAFALAACGATDHSGMDMAEDGMDHDEATPVAEGARRIEVTARSFEFDPDEITVTVGEDVAIVLTSEDILHDFTVEDLDAHVGAKPRETAEGGLRADEPGRHSFFCSVPGHREAGMEGTLIVEDG